MINWAASLSNIAFENILECARSARCRYKGEATKLRSLSQLRHVDPHQVPFRDLLPGLFSLLFRTERPEDLPSASPILTRDGPREQGRIGWESEYCIGNSAHLTAACGELYQVAISPDGTEIVISLCRSATLDTQYLVSSLCKPFSAQRKIAMLHKQSGLPGGRARGHATCKAAVSPLCHAHQLCTVSIGEHHPAACISAEAAGAIKTRAPAASNAHDAPGCHVHWRWAGAAGAGRCCLRMRMNLLCTQGNIKSQKP